jgi:hypothetical protein
MVVRAQIGFPLNDDFPHSVVQVNPHYAQGTDVNGLLTVLMNNVKSITNVGDVPFTIKLYDAEKPPPSYPLAQATNKTGHTVSGVPGELALCLSYYAGFNRPQFRGRIYIPSAFIPGSYGLRPSAGQQAAALEWNKLFKSLPAPWAAGVYSRKAGSAALITNCWVDDEWDIQRSRGMKPTTRVTATVP